MPKVTAKKPKSDKTPSSQQPNSPGNETVSVAADAKHHRGWEMSPSEALRVNYVDQEIISENRS